MLWEVLSVRDVILEPKDRRPTCCPFPTVLDMPRSKMRFGLLFSIFMLLLVNHVFVSPWVLGEDGGTSESSVESHSLSFDEIKASGAKRSRYASGDFKPLTGETPKPDLHQFKQAVLPNLRRFCMDCHDADVQEGNLRIDTLNPDLQTGDDISWWLEVLAVLTNGEMPPPDAEELPDADRARLVQWLSSEIQVASVVRRSKRASSSFRRMTKYEYNHALQDLLGLPWDFAKDLPPEAVSDDGFQNSSDLLHMTGMQLDTYRASARRALQRAMPSGDRPEPLHWSVSMKQASMIEWPKHAEQIKKAEEKFADDPSKLKVELERLKKSFRQPHGGTYFRDQRSGHTIRSSWAYYGAKYAHSPVEKLEAFPANSDHDAVIPRGQGLIVELGDQIPDHGMMRVRARASRGPDAGEAIPSLQLQFGWRASNEGRALLRVSAEDVEVTADPDQPAIYEWTVPLGEIYPRNSVRNVTKMGAMPNPSEYIRFYNNSVSQGDIQIDHVQVSTPVYDTWPPKSCTDILLERDPEEDERDHVRKVLATFMQRAWRRQISADEIDLKIDFFKTIRPECETFEEAVVEVLASVLSSPNFLYLRRAGLGGAASQDERVGHLTDIDLATRLSMFLWCSVPDEELLSLAINQKLGTPEVLEQQVVRMLSDRRADRFARQFVMQWLGMQTLEYLDIDRKTRPQFTPALKEAMMHEPVAFFSEVLGGNRSVLDFIHSDFAMLNEVLARHYGIHGITGNRFQRVSLNLEQRRGGVLTQAGPLTMNSAGNDSHPLKRGIWLLENLLNDPPPPPPPAVPEIDLADPEIAKLTLKEQLANHRNQAACMSCHAKIDPWGIAFENFDALGRWRNQIEGQPVDATSRLFNDQQLDGMDGLKKFILANRQDQFVRALTYKLSAYAVGRPLTFADHASVDRIVAGVRQRNDGLADLIRLIVTSDLFREP